VCAGFGCAPTAAKAELENDPHLVWEILDLRAYARTKAAIDAAGGDPTRAPHGPLADWVMDVQADILHPEQPDGRE
jgi:hypothetical protein